MSILKNNGLIKYKPGNYNNPAKIAIYNISNLKECTGSNKISNLKPYIFIYEVFLNFTLTQQYQASI
jgi:hypothetical protein